MTPLDLQPRPSPFRSAKKYFIAVEGEKAEVEYFRGLDAHGFIPDPRKVVLRILPTQGGLSAPSHVVARLSAHIRREVPRKDLDECWIVVDVDRWERNLHEALADADVAGYAPAVSNPCFEVWLQLHFGEEVVASSRDQAKTAFRALKHRAGLAWPYSDADVDAACVRAGALDNGKDIPVPGASHVHRLVGRLRALR